MSARGLRTYEQKCKFFSSSCKNTSFFNTEISEIVEIFSPHHKNLHFISGKRSPPLMDMSAFFFDGSSNVLNNYLWMLVYELDKLHSIQNPKKGSKLISGNDELFQNILWQASQPASNLGKSHIHPYIHPYITASFSLEAEEVNYNYTGL